MPLDTQARHLLEISRCRKKNGQSEGIRTQDPYTPSVGNRWCYNGFLPLFLIWIALNQVRYPGKSGNKMVTLLFVVASLSVSVVSISFFEYYRHVCHHHVEYKWIRLVKFAER